MIYLSPLQLGGNGMVIAHYQCFTMLVVLMVKLWLHFSARQREKGSRSLQPWSLHSFSFLFLTFLQC